MFTSLDLDHAQRHVDQLNVALVRGDLVAARAHCEEAIADLSCALADIAIELGRQLARDT